MTTKLEAAATVIFQGAKRSLTTMKSAAGNFVEVTEKIRAEGGRHKWRTVTLVENEPYLLARALLTPMPGEDGLVRDTAEAAVAVAGLAANVKAGNYAAAVRAAKLAVEQVYAIARQIEFKHRLVDNQRQSVRVTDEGGKEEGERAADAVGIGA